MRARIIEGVEDGDGYGLSWGLDVAIHLKGIGQSWSPTWWVEFLFEVYSDRGAVMWRKNLTDARPEDSH
jgi:hypothetical protein